MTEGAECTDNSPAFQLLRLKSNGACWICGVVNVHLIMYCINWSDNEFMHECRGTGSLCHSMFRLTGFWSLMIHWQCTLGYTMTILFNVFKGYTTYRLYIYRSGCIVYVPCVVPIKVQMHAPLAKFIFQLDTIDKWCMPAHDSRPTLRAEFANEREWDRGERKGDCLWVRFPPSKGTHFHTLAD